MPPSPGGLSPRVRGNRRAGRVFDLSNGSIPACTGEPSPDHQPVLNRRVYPRVYGGTAYRCQVWPPSVGLSPRVRGNPMSRGLICESFRSIPACTGEPTPFICVVVVSRVYPRVYGGTPWSVGASVSGYGLSPRVRGNPGDRARAERAVGSIPACTGEPLTAPFP